MSHFFRLLMFGLVLVFSTSSTYAQKSRTALEKEKSKIRKEIEYKNELLKETKKTKKKSLNQLVLVRMKIKNRENLISTLRSEMQLIEGEIDATKNEIYRKEDELKALKDEYAKMIYHAYKTRSSYDKIMFVFASEDFNQAYKRLKYLQQYSQFRQAQAEQITLTKTQLDTQITRLEEKKVEKELLIVNTKQERNTLSEDIGEKQKLFNDLNSKEKELKDEIKKNEKESRKLQKAIQRIIQIEIEKTNKGRKGKGKYVLTPEAKALSSNFENNKGKLPWPTSKGVVTAYYGEHWHPVLKGIKIYNNGVDISTNGDGKARAVFEGEVSGVIVLPGSGKAVMVRHGAYISVYANLVDVFVQKGDKLTTKQEIGKAKTNQQKGQTHVHFELWKGQTTMNPAQWLYQFK